MTFFLSFFFFLEMLINLKVRVWNVSHPRKGKLRCVIKVIKLETKEDCNKKKK